MDNVCHTLAGAALARAGLERITPLATPTLLVASNLPDADIVSWYWGDLSYLVYHRGITHSWVGIVALSFILAGAMFGLGLLLSRRTPGARRPSFWGLVAVAAIGHAVHLLLDFTNSYGIRPNLPFEDRWLYGDLVFIVDPWLWLILAGALFVGSSKSKVNTGAFALLLAAMSFAMVAGSRSTQVEQGGALWFWAVGLAVILTAHFAVGGRFRVVSSRVALVAVVAYWTGLAVLHDRAVGYATDNQNIASAGAATKLSALPTLIYPNRWRVITESADWIDEYSVDALTGSVVPTAHFDRNSHSSEAIAALESCPGRVAKWFNRFLVVDLVRNGDDSTTVYLRDIRFPNGAPRGFAVTPVSLGPSLEVLENTKACPGR